MKKSRKVLVTGGAGYIGSTICSALNDEGFEPLVLDNLVQGRAEFAERFPFYRGDVADKELLNRVVRDHGDLAATIHCAALIVVPESTSNPEIYYRENVSKSLELFSNLKALGQPNIIFSSSASVYGGAKGDVMREDAMLEPSSPYARTKLMIEQILEDFCAAYDMKALCLRYFNPIGADPKLRTGPYVKNPSHILGSLVKALNGDRTFSITGTSWPTRDGTGLRDYIHVWDLAKAHVNAVSYFHEALSSRSQEGDVSSRYRIINLGTGCGVTVREFVSAFEEVSSVSLKVKEAPPRAGDNAGCFANFDLAKRLIRWQPTHSIQDGIRSAIEWNKKFSGLI